MDGTWITPSIAFCCFLSIAPATHASNILSIDFQNSDGVTGAPVTQAGFQAFDNTDLNSHAYGNVTVTVSGQDVNLGGLFNRNNLSNGGSFTFAPLYNDFLFKNTSALAGSVSAGTESIGLALAGVGIAANTDYVLTLYSFDPDPVLGGTHQVTFSPTGGTTGSALTLTYTADPASAPTTNGQYSVTGTFHSTGAGTLDISVSDTFSGNTVTGQHASGVRLNGFELTDASVPEPATLALLGLGLFGLGWSRRTRSS